MVKKTTKVASKATTKRTPIKKAPAKKVAAKPTKTAAKSKRTVTRKNDKVDYYPNRMTFAVSFAAVMIMVLLGLIVAINIKYFS